MQSNRKSGPNPGNAGILSSRGWERAAAILLLLYVLAVAISVTARVSGNPVSGNPYVRVVAPEPSVSGAGNSEPDLIPVGVAATPGGVVVTLELSPSWYVYAASQATNLLAAFILTALAAVSYRVFRHYEPTLALTGAFMFLGAAGFAALSGITGLALIREYGTHTFGWASSAEAENLVGIYAFLEPLRALAGRVGFTFGGLALLAFGGLIAWSGALPRWVGWLGLPTGALMFFIWYADAAALHRGGGGAYLLWLTLLAGLLFFRGCSSRGTGGVAAQAGNTEYGEG